MEFNDNQFASAARELEKMYGMDLSDELKRERSFDTERNVGSFYQALNDLGTPASMGLVLYFLRQYIREFRAEVPLAAADAGEIIHRELSERYAPKAGPNTTRLLTIIDVLCRQTKSHQPSATS